MRDLFTNEITRVAGGSFTMFAFGTAFGLGVGLPAGAALYHHYFANHINLPITMPNSAYKLDPTAQQLLANFQNQFAFNVK